MSESHHMSISEYEGKLSNQLEVEKKREQEYKKSKNMIAEIDRQIYK